MILINNTYIKPLLWPPENGGLHDDHVGALHAGQVSLPVLRPSQHGRPTGRPRSSPTSSPSATRQDLRPPGAAAGRPARPAAESVCSGSSPDLQYIISYDITIHYYIITQCTLALLLEVFVQVTHLSYNTLYTLVVIRGTHLYLSLHYHTYDIVHY